mmetsp:Transcript_19452/g.47789  ORF Transcript_19452/g.47789 Transcript_19452/m.47789 type:complete len:294 (-) Transcript_19452:35-916(-)
MPTGGTLLLLTIATAAVAAAAAAAMPLPFTRVLTSGARGADVRTAQYMLRRSAGGGRVALDGVYGAGTAAAVTAMQRAHGLHADGVLGANSAGALLRYYQSDSYSDALRWPLPSPYAYKVHITTWRDRTRESPNATLYDAAGTPLLSFVARLHGKNLPDDPSRQRNMFTSDGVTPTGLMRFDLNSPEPYPRSYGPYPVNRAVDGVDGNAAFILTGNRTTMLRTGILLHTGEWPNWTPGDAMPNSDGCIHAYPDAIKTVWQKLVALGVDVRKNPFGTLPYPYAPQGLLSVEELD